MITNQPSIETFDQWYFYDGYLCTPQGDRFSPECIRACFYYRQLREVSHLLHWRPGDVGQDYWMEDLSSSGGLRRVADIASSIPAGQARERGTRVRAPKGDSELLALLTQRLDADMPVVQSIVCND